MTTAEIQAAIAKLDEEIGVTGSVQATAFEGQTTTFRSMDDLLKLRAHYERLLKATDGESTTRYAAISKGV